MPRDGGRELGHPEQTAKSVHGGSHVQLQVGVHTAVTARAGSTILIAIPFSHFSKGWHALHQVCGAGAIALLAQGGPPHPKHGSYHWKSWCRPTDRSEDRPTVSRLSSQAG